MRRYDKEQLKKEILILKKQCHEAAHKALFLISKNSIHINYKINCKGNLYYLMGLNGALLPAAMLMMNKLIKGMDIQPKDLNEFNYLFPEKFSINE
jgi:hypothetical protein